MLYHRNGRLGNLSVIGLGCWNFGGQWNKTSEEESINIIHYLIDSGVNFVDVAESYGVPDGQCEQILGKALMNGYREKVFIVSKVGWYGRRTADHFSYVDSQWGKLGKRLFNRLYRFNEIEFNRHNPEFLRLCGHACCGRLRTQYIDLLLCHDGNPKDADSFIKAFRQLKNEGFIKYYGISTDSLSVLKSFYEMSDGECAACECDYSLINRQAEHGLFEFCKEHDITILTRGTLSRGLLSSKYDEHTVFKEPSRLDWNKGGRNRVHYLSMLNRINRIKQAIGETNLTEVSYQYAFSQKESPSVVMGCTSMEQARHNIAIASKYINSEMLELLKNIQ